VAYALFALVSLRAFHGGFRPASARAVVGAVVLTLVYAALDEWHQSQVPGRFPSVVDWVADAIGVGLAVAAFRLVTTHVARSRGTSALDAQES
jgi:VanZ family protein